MFFIVINKNAKITWLNDSYDIIEIKDIVFNDVNIAKILKLSKRLS